MMINALENIFRGTLLLICAVGLVAIVVGIALHTMGKAWGIVRNKLPPMALCVFCVLATMAVFYGGSKGISIQDPYIVDDGSYLTNDVVHISIKKRVSILPDSTEILVFYRHEDNTNVEDWVEFTPRLTFADFPYDYILHSATNYDIMVAASYTPEPTVHTNGVWIVKGFVMPNDGGKNVFVNTRVRAIQTEDEK